MIGSELKARFLVSREVIWNAGKFSCVVGRILDGERVCYLVLELSKAWQSHSCPRIAQRDAI